MFACILRLAGLAPRFNFIVKPNEAPPFLYFVSWRMESLPPPPLPVLEVRDSQLPGG